ncbi:MAG: family 43 glycosylhydrolase [Rikenellaceae bacterium]
MKKSLFLILSLFLASSVAIAQKQILPDFHADPSAHQWDGKYWIYPSTDEPGSTSWEEMERWKLYSSTDLAEWKDEGQIFSLDDVSWASNAAFAPDAVKRNGKYYFFFPAGMQIGVAVSDTPTGQYKDAIGKPLISTKEHDNISSFDPCIFTDDDGTPYLYYGNSWGKVGCVKLKDNLIEKDGEIQTLMIKNYHEGIWVHKRNDTYYFTYPSMYTDIDGKKKQVLELTTAPSPTGPFTYRGQFFFNNSRNSHHSIIEIEDKWYLFYHIEGPSPYERRVCVEYLRYEKDGSIKMVNMTKRGIKALKK